jgi:transcriptional regulator with XRE-family HTH domain
MVTPWKNIDEARKAQGLTLKEMARRAGISEAAVQKWKNGKPITFDTLERIAVALNTTAVSLMHAPAEQAPASEASPLYTLPPQHAPPGMVRESPAPYMRDHVVEACENLARRMARVEELLIAILAEQQRNSQEKKGP